MSQINQDINKKIQIFSSNLRKHILKMAVTAGSNSAHFGGALSIVEIVSTLFSHKMKIDKKKQQRLHQLIFQRLHQLIFKANQKDENT